MPLTIAQLQTAYLDAWLEGMCAFRQATCSDDEVALDSIDVRLQLSRVQVEDEAGHPLDRLAGLGFTDGYTAARTGYSAASKAAPWQAVAPK
jgi:hypothetical protein